MKAVDGTHSLGGASRRALLLSLAGAVACRAAPGARAPLRFPLIVPLSGDFAEFGRTEVDAARLAAAEANARARGPRIELLIRDSEHRAPRGLELFEELWAEAPFGFCYAASSEVALALAPLCRERGVLLLSDAASPRVAEECPLAFRHCPDSVTESETLVRHAAGALGARRLALAHVQGAYGESYARPVREAAARAGVELGAVRSFAPTEDDFAELVRALLESRPDAVLCIGLGPPLARLVQSIRAAPFTGPVLAAASIAYPGAREAAPEACEGVLFADVWLDERNPTCAQFLALHREAYGGSPSPLGAMAFDAFSLLFQALREAGSDPVRAAAWLEAHRSVQGACGRIRLEQRRFLFELVMLVLADGRARPAGER